MRSPVLIFIFSFSIFVSLRARANAPLSFDKALHRLMDQDTSVRNQRATLSQAEASRLASVAAFLPTLQAQASDQKTYFPMLVHTQQGLLQANLNLFRSGGDIAALKSQSATVAADRFQLQKTVLDEEQTNVELLIHYIQAARQVKVAENLKHLNQELAAIESTRYHRGLIPLQESQKALVEENNSQARLSDARSNFEQARSALSAQLGTDHVAAEWPWKHLLESARAEKWLAQPFAIQNLPGWNATTKLVESADELERARFRAFLPSLDLSVAYGYPDYLNSKQPGWETTVTFTIPLFSLKSYSDYRVQTEQEELAEIDQEKAKRSTLDQWQQSKRKLELSLKSAREREANVKLAESLYQDNQRRLRAGRSSMNDVVVDQNRLSDAETLAISGWADAHILFSQLCHSLGHRLSDCL